MVGITSIERRICYFGLFTLYSYAAYKFYITKNSFDIKFHDAFINEGKKFVNGFNNPNLKFINTPNRKILFLLGVKNDPSYLTNENFEIIRMIIENFTPDVFIYEKNLK